MGDDRFIELVNKKLTDEISPEESKEFQHYLINDEIKRRDFEFLNIYWNSSDTNYVDNALSFQKIKEKIKNQETAAATATLKKTSFYSWRAAAAIILLAGCAYFFYSKLISPVSPALVATKNSWQNKNTVKREKSTIVLTDGTRIILNSQSSLRYPTAFTGKTREVYLSGEAFFDVYKDRAHPFIIHTEKMNIKVLGTAFNVKSYPNEPQSETTLIRGAIEVTLDDRPSDRIILKPSEKLIVKNRLFKTVRENAGKLNHAETNMGMQYVLTSFTPLHQGDSTVLETSWTQNKFIFRDESFTALAARMERWYGIDIKFKNDSLKQYRFSGVFEKETINQALDALRMTENFSYKIKKTTIYLY
ncbi:FecR family protein [Mucilaginibacter pocheonensis]|uniref:Ferric-dicitrate binding protein FerR (Iron transport regulator) n=1 Tax=Mucilaginibacter pocheonensis TaxID=398050 RepID=A0ABU1TED9_9SPHI|nr:FecR family protein [Mucilaginibacter pocheonensis]MDR6943550.1 ferric-dicitrate binding protein FerR (iron transport regulator) [Mucilaginibacter pocheonensis]